MVFEKRVESPNLGDSYSCVDHTTYGSEYVSLVYFASRLGSYNCTSKPGVVDIDEGNTRAEAELLMSLVLSPIPKNFESENNFHVFPSSCNGNRNFYESDSSLPSASLRTPRRSFTFVCPSLSLENSSSSCNTGKLKFQTAKDTHDNISSSARLLGRPLKVDDKNALRLSADAMARNILKSFQQAVEWRVDSWTQTLTNHLVQTEHEMKKAGASTEDIMELMNTSEAAVILQLRDVANAISVTSVQTSFEVLPEKVATDDDLSGPLKKRQRSEANEEPINARSTLEEEDEYQYSVAHNLMFHCVINLNTSAGYSEISFDVPGTIEGTFLSTKSQAEQLRSVVVNLNTNILAAMVEKGCRTVVRASVEYCIEQNKAVQIPNDEALDMARVDHEPKLKTPTTNQGDTVKRPRDLKQFSTPPRQSSARQKPPAFVTPKAEWSGESLKAPPSSSVLMPIPDDFVRNEANTIIPRRISPQPTSPELNPSSYDIFPMDGNDSQVPSTTQTQSQQRAKSATFLNHTLNKPHLTAKMTSSQRLPLISPTANEFMYKDVPENGPSIPMLVEAAHRVKNVD